MLVLASAEAVAEITAGGTILAAVIIAVLAAWTAGRRQKRQLDAEGKRQAATLAHGREVATLSLSAERALADLADLRKLLDEAAVALDGARDARDELDVSLTEHGVALPDEPKRQFKECGQGLVALSARLNGASRRGRPDCVALRGGV